jgi:glycosyltransferase involved in cell wall biosynthesis
MGIPKSDSKHPVFTVVIPCKNRAEYLHHTLRTCIVQEYENFEVIVSDDGSTDNSRDIVADATRRDPRIRFISHRIGVGMRDNFEDALSAVKPGYVLALGGDDGLMPDGISGMHEALQNAEMELLAWPTPSFSYANVRGPNGQLKVSFDKGDRIINSEAFLTRQTEHFHYVSDVESPMIYVKGVVSTNLIDKVRSRSGDGRFYSCQTPDGYSGIVLAGEVEQYAFSGRPFSLHGVSPSSQGGAYLSSGAEGKKASVSFYESVKQFPLHRELASQPYSPLITLMTAEYLLRSKDLPGWGGKFPPLDFKRLLLKGINELTHRLYGEDRICRELAILKNIAEMHGLSAYFSKLVRKTMRSRTRPPFDGSGANFQSLFLDAKAFKIDNIFDASYAAKDIYNLATQVNPASIARGLVRSVGYRINSYFAKKHFPPESEWNN